MADAYWSNVELLVPMEGANGSTTFTDISPNNHTPALLGSPAISTTQSKWGYGSGYFSNSRLIYDVAIFDFNPSQTFELYFFAENAGVLRPIFDSRESSSLSKGWAIVLNTSAKLVFTLYDTSGGAGGALYNVAGATTVTMNTWHHFAVVRDNGYYKTYLDGELLHNVGDVGYVGGGTSGLLGVGYNTSSTFYAFRGYFQDLRVTKDVARYTANFTPPGRLNIDYSVGINGTVYEKNTSGVFVPGAYPVRVYKRSDGSLVASTTSAEDGTYSFTGVADDEYYVMALDNSVPIQRSAIADKVVPS